MTIAADLVRPIHRATARQARIASRSLVAFAACAWMAGAGATDYCVASVQDLAAVSAALLAQAPGAQNVRIAEGTYVMDEPTLVAFSGALTVQGGYDATCTRHTPGAARTVLRPLAPEAFQPSFHAFGDISISDLTLDGFVGAFMWPIGTQFSLTVMRLALLQKSSAGIALEMSSQGGNKNLSNLLIDASTPACALAASVEAGNRIDASFLTVVNRGSGPAACVRASGSDVTLRNAIAYAATGSDVDIAAGTALLASSVFAEVAGGGSLDAASSDNLTGPIAFDTSMAPLDRDRPADLPDQPARDSAVAIAGVDVDVLGNPRVVGGAPDRGAFELQGDAVFGDGFEIPTAGGQ